MRLRGFFALHKWRACAPCTLLDLRYTQEKAVAITGTEEIVQQPFSELQAVFLKSIVEALFVDADMAIPPDQVVDNLQHQFGMVDGDKPDQIGLLIDGLSIVLGGPAFLIASPEERANIIRDVLENSEIGLFRDLARIRSIVYAGYYGHWDGVTQDDNAANPVHAQIGFTLPKFRARGPDEEQITLYPGRELTHDDFVGDDGVPAEVDVVVIGSGAGGAVAAEALAGWGHDVLIVEAGAHWPSQMMTHEERRMTAKLFVDGGVQSSRDNDFIVFQARCIGGGTAINNGIVLQFNDPGLTHPDAPDVLTKWASIGATLDRNAFFASYDAVEARLGVEPIDPKSGRNNGPHLLNGWAAYAAASSDPMDTRAVAAWFRKNWGPRSVGAACVYCGYCNTGCPYGRKHAMAQSYLLWARAKGARILAEASVTRIDWDDDRVGVKRVARGVRITLADGRDRTVRVKKGVVVAAGTMASSRILDASGIEGTGEGISLNIASPVPALMPYDMRIWDEDQMATYVDRGDFLLESHFQPPMSMASLMPGWFGDHAARMKNYSRLASAGILFPADRRGRLVGGKLSFKLQLDEDLPRIRAAIATLVRVHFAAGALEVYPAVHKGPVIRPGDDVDAILRAQIDRADDVTLSSSHPHGGNAINEDPMLGVVDTDCRVHGTANVIVADASTFPSCIRVNAQLTTMAMAHYATARHDPFA